MAVDNYQNLVIGSGVAGKLLGWTLAKRGQKSVVVERSMIGGSCPNVACLPSKNVVYSAKAVSLVDPKRGLGVTTGEFRVDMPGVARRKRRMSSSLLPENIGPQTTSIQPIFPRTLSIQGPLGTRKKHWNTEAHGIARKTTRPGEGSPVCCRQN